MTVERFKRVLLATLLAFASLVVALGGLAIVASFVWPMCHRGDQRREYASSSIKGIGEAFNEFAQAEGYYPEPTQGLIALVHRNLLDKIPVDAWGHEYEYSVDEETFTVKSFGADGREGGTDAAADIVRTIPKIRPLASDAHRQRKG